jgi:hypothetical protein
MKASVVDVAKVWVMRASANTPVLTGAARASFLKLAFKTKISISISPKKKSRIPLGVGTSTGNVFYIKGKLYGFEWSSALDHIQLVDRYDQFLKAAEVAFLHARPYLPQPVITYTGRG